MAYLSWSHSHWHAYKTVGTGPGDDTVLTLHSGNGSLWLRAAELRSCGATRDVSALRAFVESRLAASTPRAGGLCRPSTQDWVELRRAVDDFLRSAYRGGEVPIPPEVLRRYRVCQRLIQRWIRRGCRAPELQDPSDERAQKQFANLCGWWRYTKQVLIDYPPPPVPRTIQELEFKRSQRVLLGESVSAEQDAQERALIRSRQRQTSPSWHCDRHADTSLKTDGRCPVPPDARIHDAGFCAFLRSTSGADQFSPLGPGPLPLRS